MQDYETEHLSTLSNIEWFMYPFKKTAKVVLRKLGLCRNNRGENDFIKGEDNGKNNK